MDEEAKYLIINNANKQFFRDQIQALQEKHINNNELYVFNPNNVSEEEIEKLKTTLFCCNMLCCKK